MVWPLGPWVSKKIRKYKRQILVITWGGMGALGYLPAAASLAFPGCKLWRDCLYGSIITLSTMEKYFHFSLEKLQYLTGEVFSLLANFIQFFPVST